MRGILLFAPARPARGRHLTALTGADLPQLAYGFRVGWLAVIGSAARH